MTIWSILLILIILVHVGLHYVISDTGEFLRNAFKKNDKD